MSVWINFYRPFFENEELARNFVENIEGYQPDDSMYRALIMMHQAQRLISIADDIEQIRPNKYSLKLMFLIICTENIAKQFEKFDDDGRSKEFVKKFFNNFTSPSDKQLLQSSFKKLDYTNLTIDEISNILYTVRCDVVHEGKYWSFQFKHDGLPMLNLDPDVNVYISYEDFRNIIVRCCINAIKSFS